MGDGQDLSAFAAAHSVPLTRFAFLLCGDRYQAEDLVQDAFAAVYRRFGERFAVQAPLAYARTTITHAYLAASRRRAATEIPVAEFPDRSAAPVDLAEQDAVWAALERISARQRAVLVMRYYLDLSDGAIAALLDCRRGTVRSLASRALAALRTDPTLEGE